MTENPTLYQGKIISRERTLADAAAMSLLSPDSGAKLIATIRQYADELQAARLARYGNALTATASSRDC